MEKNKTKFTPEQYVAMGIDSHLAVSANAGSGKTFVLVQRYINLLKNGVKPEEIVAITFTKKAAKEILERIYKNIDKELQSPECSELEKRLLLSAKKTMYKSSIGTIHKFCRSLIDLYGFEAGLPKSNVVIEEYEYKKIEKSIFSKTLKEFINQPTFSYIGSFTEVLRLYSIPEIRTILESVVKKLDRFEEIQSVNSSDFETMKNYLQSKFENAFHECIFNIGTKTVEYIPALESEVTPSKKFPEKKETFYPIFNFLEQSISLSNEVPKNLIDEYIKSVKDVISGTNHMKQPISRHLTSIKDSINSQIELLKTLSQFSINYLTEYSRLQIQIVQFVFAVIRNIHVHLQSESLYTQDGILQYTLEIVRKPELQKDIIEKFKYYMIDEFQDTNQLQLSIFSYLVPSLFSKNSSQNGNFYIVGDEKQSIYGFRSADVRVFGKAKEYIINSNAEKNILQNGSIQLTATFRLLPTICAIVNEFGKKFIKKEISVFDVEYTPLVCGRKWEYPNTSTITLLIAEYKVPFKQSSIETEVIDENEIDSGDEGSILDEQDNDAIPIDIVKMISNHILSIVNTLEIEEIDPQSNQITKRFCTYKDIAIISAERSKYKNLQKEFSEKNIPSSFDSESNFFELPEIEDIFSFLEFLYDPENDLALASILRSPFFGFSTGDLIELSRIKGGESLWRKLHLAKECEETSQNNQQKLYLRTWNILSDLLPLAARLQITLLVKTILIKTQYFQYLRKKTNGNSIRKNIESMISIIRQKQQEGFKTIEDFIDDIRERIISKSTISQQEVSDQKDAVTILSIHGSKGLEFPVVIFLDNEAKSGRKTNSTIDISGLINVPLYIRKNNTKSQLTNPFSTLTSLQEKEKEFAEKKRKIYVALTRAKDHLVIAGFYKETSNDTKFVANSAMDMLMKSLDIDAHYVKSLEQQPVTIAKTLKLDYYSNEADTKQIQTKEIIVPIQLIPSISNVDNSNDKQILNAQGNSNLVAINKPSTLFFETIGKSQIIHTASQLMAFAKDPIEYYYSTKLGIKSNKNAYFEFEIENSKNTEDDTVSGTEFGSAVHELIALKNICYNSNNTLNETIFQTIQEKIRLKYGFLTDESHLVKTLTFKAWDYLDKNHYCGSNVHFESAYTAMFEQDLIRGIFDCVYISGNKAIIIDWKTNKLHENSISNLIELYSLQMDLYTLVCFEMQQIEHVETHLVFLNTSNAEPEIAVKKIQRQDISSLRASFSKRFAAIHTLFEEGITSIVTL